jgi:hypothetical protein
MKAFMSLNVSNLPLLFISHFVFRSQRAEFFFSKGKEVARFFSKVAKFESFKDKKLSSSMIKFFNLPFSYNYSCNMTMVLEYNILAHNINKQVDFRL